MRGCRGARLWTGCLVALVSDSHSCSSLECQWCGIECAVQGSGEGTAPHEGTRGRGAVTGTPVARSYRLPSSANASKLAAVAELLPLWRAGLGRSQSVIRRHLLTTGELPRWVDAKGWDGGLSQRQWDSVSAQALGAHRSWLGHCGRGF